MACATAAAILVWQQHNHQKKNQKKVNNNTTTEGNHQEEPDEPLVRVAPPKSATSMRKTLSQFSSPQLPWFFLQEARQFGTTAASSIPPAFELNVRFLPWKPPVLVVTDAHVAKQVLLDPSSEKASSFTGKSSPLTGNVNLLRSPTHSAYWKRLRKQVAPAFSSRQVQRMNAICRHCVDDWIVKTLEPLVERAEEEGVADGATLDPAAEMTKLTTRVICQAAFEYANVSDEEIVQFLHHMEVALKEFTLKQNFNPWRASMFGKWCYSSVRQAHASAQWTRDFCQTMLTSYRQEQLKQEEEEEEEARRKNAAGNKEEDDDNAIRNNSNKNTASSSSSSVLRLLVENTDLSETDRIGEMVTFLLGGYDTTGYTLGNALTLLAEHPKVAQKLRTKLIQAEQKALLELTTTTSSSTTNDAATIDRVRRSAWSNCPYLHCVIKETFRLYPVAAMGPGSRKLDHDLLIPLAEEQDGDDDKTTKKPIKKVMVLPKGSTIAVPQIIFHRHPGVFGNETVDLFDPDRWEDDDNASNETKKRMNHSLFTFSMGSRSCVAQALATAEIQSVLPRLIRHYRFSVQQTGQADFFLTLKLANYRLSVTKYSNEGDNDDDDDDHT
ncbi:hypothetical protein ACA910_007574 [Epithemia clementina (nom. ined.)]